MSQSYMWYTLISHNRGNDYWSPRDSEMFQWETSGPDIHLDASLTSTTYLDIVEVLQFAFHITISAQEWHGD